MRIGTMLDVKTIKNLEEIKSEKSFEEQYDEGLRRLNFNRQRMNEFKTLRESRKFLVRKGYYGTQGHFLWCTEVLGLELETVPILGEMTITKDLLLQFQQAPKEDGEGVVIEFEDGTHYKAKSMDYYSNI